MATFYILCVLLITPHLITSQPGKCVFFFSSDIDLAALNPQNMLPFVLWCSGCCKEMHHSNYTASLKRCIIGRPIFLIYATAQIYATHNFEWIKMTYICRIRIKIYDNLANSILISLMMYCIFEGQTERSRTAIAVISPLTLKSA